MHIIITHTVVSSDFYLMSWSARLYCDFMYTVPFARTAIPDSVRDVSVCSECDLESHVDRHSLAVIYQHKREIVRRLSQRRESETGSDTRTEPGQKVRVIRCF